MKRLLLTGGAGFIGHHFVEHLLKNTDWEIVILDRLNYASTGFDRLRDISVFDESRVHMFTSDFTKPIVDGLAKEIGDIHYIVHMGAETHVDNSIKDPRSFVMANITGAMEMLEYAKTLKNLEKFVYFSTDEVYGPAPEGINYEEGDRHNPGNPYAASKSAAEALCIAYANTYQMPIMITNTMNVFGERQHPEKFIPMTIRNIKDGNLVTIHSNQDKTKAGSRYYIHARNVSSALLYVLQNVNEFLSIHNAKQGKFNIVGEIEIDNLSLVQLIAKIMDKDLKYEMVDFHSSRPGHDLRYALSGKKLAELGWEVPATFEESLRKVIEWTLERPQWFELAKSQTQPGM